MKTTGFPALWLLLACCFISIEVSAQSTINFEYSQSLIFIKVKIDNKSDLLFLLNTAANTSVIDKRVAEALKLPVVKQLDSVEGTAGKEAVAIVKVRAMQIGKLVMRDMQVTRRNISKYINLRGQKPDGILGTDVLRNFAVIIDYKTYKIAFQQAKIPAGRKKTIGFDMPEGIPRFEILMNDSFSTYVHFNSGVSLAPSKETYINLSPEQWEEIQKHNSTLVPSKYLSGNGVGGNIYLEVIPIRCVELNNRIKLYNAYVILQPKEGYFKKDEAIGFFGNNLFEKFERVSIDFLSRQVVLPQNAASNAQKTVFR
jgi:hypothetical protein